MLNFQKLTSKDLDDKQRVAYQQMVTPELFPFFANSLKDHAHGFALGFSVDHEPVGLGLVKIEDSRAEIELLYISKPFHHLAQSFLESIEKEAKKENCYIILFLYSAEEAHFFDPLLIAKGWAKPHPYLKKYTFDVQAFHPTWYEKSIKQSEGYQQFLWQKLKENDKSEILQKIKNGIIPQQLSPFNEKKPELINSLGLKHHDQVIGWIITHRVNSDTIRYSSLFIEKPYQYLGLSIDLLKHSIALQQKSPIRWSEFEINLYQIDYNWLQFIKRRLAPYAQAISITNRSFKEL